MKIARDKRIAKAEHVQLLPASWGALYELTKLDDSTFAQAIAAKTIRPDMERGEAQRLMKVAKDGRITKAAHGQLLPAAWGTVYELTKLDDSTFAQAIAAKTIRPDMERGARRTPFAPRGI